MKQLFFKLKCVCLFITLCIQTNSYSQCDPSAPNIGVQAEAISSITIIKGTSTTLSSPITGSSYQWTKDGANILGANSANLVLNNFNSVDVGEYTIIVDGVTLVNTISLAILENTISGYESDRQALIDLYNSTNGPAWTNSTNWLTGPIENWEGVTVTNCRVTRLNLQANNLNGTLPASFSNLTGLKYLYLKENDISGVLDISSMTSLTILNAQNNNFNDIIFGSNNSLQRINISSNPIISGKTIDLSAMRELIDFRAVGLGLNQLTLSGDYNNLRYLLVQDNNLTGTLDMSKMPKITIVFAHNNQFTDFNLGTGAELQRFYFYNNPVISGKSIDISSMRNLLDFRIQNLGISNITQSGTYNKMLYFLIQDNQISGTFDISNMPNLVLAFAHNNQFTDFSLGNNTKLSRLYLYNNPIIPGKTMDISSMRALLDFRVQNLGLSDLVMSGTYSNMYYFIVQDNNITGDLDLSTMLNLRLCYAKSNFYENLILPTNFADVDSELTHINVRDNSLHFDDLIPYNSIFSTTNFYYAPQRNVITQVSGNTLSVNVGGATNYNWTPSGSGNPLVTTSNGTYACATSNPSQVPGLVIHSNPVTVSQSARFINKTNNEIGKLKMYPNPLPQTEAILNVELKTESSKSVHFVVYSINGKKIKDIFKKGKTGVFTYKLDLNGIPQGMYILQSEFDDKILKQKIIIQ
ncbi:T9SS type A sorting domain-containing protein [uncultured Lacinutrix sp.]|uniref:T9SS type A sorting domain-containing protein n=1 Tax=uncultured Lacinutrix sp. TaxID=574032 RepID=UPI0026035CDC|nr:T9SS type A sorting domain-containing protein [uncultured Lacinutrix sp.]